MKLNKLTIANFKGISDKVLTFGGKNATISGENAAGKTTICDAWYWLMTGRDSTLIDNPDIIPLGATEANPSVEAELDIDGKNTLVRKVQTFKTKDGKTSTTNAYFVNEVPLTERDFKAKLEELGVDVEKLLVLSHPDFLLKDTSKKNRDYIRNTILFPMAESKTDKALADDAGLTELSEMLDTYSIKEIEALEKATLTKIDKEIGKDNKVANARIDELLHSKSGLSVSQVESRKAELDAQLTEIEKQSTERLAETERLKSEDLTLGFDINSLVEDIKRDSVRTKVDLESGLVDARAKAVSLDKRKKEIEQIISDCDRTIHRNADKAEAIDRKVEMHKAASFDESLAICPTCGQAYPVDRVEEIRHQFEKSQSEAIAAYTAEIEEIASESAEASQRYDGAKKELSDLVSKQNENEEAIAGFIKGIDNIVDPNPEDNEDYKAMQQRKKEIEGRLAELVVQEVEEKMKLAELSRAMEIVKEQLSAIERDKITDERIAEIRQDIRQAEINRANAEKIIYQLTQLNKVKNESLEESINKHFKLIKWKLFKTLKNGNYEDDCTPVIDGYELWKATNKGREILAKLDIVDSLSRFYGQNNPVLLDNAESLSEVSTSRIDIGNQLIMFKVSENKELEVD